MCGSIKVCVVVERVKKLQDSLVAKLVLILIKREEGEDEEKERKERRMKKKGAKGASGGVGKERESEKGG